MHMLNSDTNSKLLSLGASVHGLCNMYIYMYIYISMEGSVVKVYPGAFVFCTTLADAASWHQETKQC